MDSSELTRLKKNRSTANSINGVTHRPSLPISGETRISYKLGSKVVTYNKRIILPSCTGPSCNEDIVYNSGSQQPEYGMTTILARTNKLINFVVVDNSNNLFWTETDSSNSSQYYIYRRDAVTNIITQIHAFNNPTEINAGLSDIVLDSSGNLYFYEYVPLSSSNFRLTKMTFNLDGSVNSTTSFPSTEIPAVSVTMGLTLDETTGDIYVTTAGHAIYKTNINGSFATALAGDGVGYLDGIGTSAKFNFLSGLTFDSVNNCLYVADANNNCIRKVDLSLPSHIVSTYSSTVGSISPTSGPNAGNVYDVDHTLAKFNLTSDVQIDSNGVLYIVDTGNNQIKKVDPSGMVTLFAGSGAFGTYNGPPLTDATFNYPLSIFVKSPSEMYIAESNGYIRKITTL